VSIIRCVDLQVQPVQHCVGALYNTYIFICLGYYEA